MKQFLKLYFSSSKYVQRSINGKEKNSWADKIAAPVINQSDILNLYHRTLTLNDWHKSCSNPIIQIGLSIFSHPRSSLFILIVQSCRCMKIKNVFLHTFKKKSFLNKRIKIEQLLEIKISSCLAVERTELTDSWPFMHAMHLALF